MADPTPEQAQQIQQIAAQVETAYRSVVALQTSLSFLINQGKATCNDVKTYNLLVTSTYFYQKSMSDTIRGMGGDAPDINPPLYVTWKGVTGDQAASIDCTQAQMAGWQPVLRGNVHLGDFYVNPAQVQWRSGPRQVDTAAIQQVLSRVKFTKATPQLGYVGLIIAIILAGVVLSVVGYIVLQIVDVLGDLPQKVEYTKQVAIAAQQHQAALDARAKCLSDCISQGKDAIACAKSCASTLPDFTAPEDSGGFGVVGWILGIALVGGLGYLGWRAWESRHALVSGVGGADGDDGDDGDDDDSIDADFIERVS